MATTSETSIINIPDSYINDETKKISQSSGNQSNINDIISDLTIARTRGFYNYINQIEPLSLFIYIIIILCIVLLSEYIPWSYKHIIGLVISIIVIYYINEGHRSTYIDKLKTTEIYMEHITPKPLFFYYDANLIEFAYNMLEYKKYNKFAYEKMIKSIDNFLELMKDVSNPSIINCTETYQVAVDMKMSALNELHSLIHSIPLDGQLIVQTKLINAIKTLQLYLQRHLDVMINLCNNKTREKGWNSQTKLIDKYELPGIDRIKFSNYHIF